MSSALRPKWFAVMLAVTVLMLSACAPSATPAQTPAETSAGAQAGTQAPADGPRYTIDIGTGPSGGQYYAIGAQAAEIIKRQTPHEANAIPSPGVSVENAKNLLAGKIQLGVALPSGVLWGRAGTNGYPKGDFEVVLAGHSTVHILFVNKDAGIKTWADLKGKRLAGPPPGGIVSWDFLDAVLDFYGLTRDDLASITPTTNVTDSADQVKIGQADAFLWPTPRGGVGPLIDLMSSGRADVLDMEPELVKHVQSKMPFMTPFELDPGYLEGTPAITALGENVHFMTLAGVDEELIYQVVKALLSDLDSFQTLMAAGTEYTPERAVSSREIVPYHAGAIRAYREAGLWK